MKYTKRGQRNMISFADFETVDASHFQGYYIFMNNAFYWWKSWIYKLWSSESLYKSDIILERLVFAYNVLAGGFKNTVTTCIFKKNLKCWIRNKKKNRKQAV